MVLVHEEDNRVEILSFIDEIVLNGKTVFKAIPEWVSGPFKEMIRDHAVEVIEDFVSTQGNYSSIKCRYKDLTFVVEISNESDSFTPIYFESIWNPDFIEEGEDSDVKSILISKWKDIDSSYRSFKLPWSLEFIDEHPELSSLVPHTTMQFTCMTGVNSESWSYSKFRVLLDALQAYAEETKMVFKESV